jgi:hypothetical protein
MAAIELKVTIELPPSGRLDVCESCLAAILRRTAESLIRDLRCHHPSKAITPEAVADEAWLRLRLRELRKEKGA